jgi:two-component system sensor histidine kinase/response regulator
LTQSDIMIVDDNPANLKLLERILTHEGYEVRSFPLGRLALTAAMNHPPDLILLDINMPEMNGYEVCARLKATPELSHIPVIILSALNEMQDKVKAFRCGAVDYISKPFQFEEVHARVQTHLKLHHLQETLKSHNERLEEAVVARTRDLAKANERLTILDSSKNEFLHLISHEFRTPLHGLLGISALILEEMPPTEEKLDLQRDLETSRRRILSILDDALLLTQIDINGAQFRYAAVPLDAALGRAMTSAAELAGTRNVTITPPPANAPFVLGDEELLARALQVLLETAVKFCEPNETVQLSIGEAPDHLAVVIETNGRTIPDSLVPKFFDLFSIADTVAPGGDLGLAPSVASRILSLFGASVGVANRSPSGIRLTIHFKQPLA